MLHTPAVRGIEQQQPESYAKRSSTVPSCTSVLLSAAAFTGACSDSWADLQALVSPTQSDVGYAWVARKVSKDFGSAKDAQSQMDDSPLPVILGPTEATSASVGLYIVDDHHTLAALDYSGFDDVTVSVVVQCDWRALPEDVFWANMNHNYVYGLARNPGNLSALPQPLADPRVDLPSAFAFTASGGTAFGDDPFRSLAGFVRKVQNSSCTDDESKYCERGFDRVCDAGGGGIPFFEFMWAYYANAVVLDTGNSSSSAAVQWWPSAADENAFNAAWLALPPSSVAQLGAVDLSAWAAAASLLVPLCRSSATGGYALPADAGFAFQALPGYVDGWAALPGDPDCAVATCVDPVAARH